MQLQQAELAQRLSFLARQGGTSGEPVVIQNNLPGIATFTDENTKIQTIWEGRGDPQGRDVKEVPPILLQNPQFREQILRGIFGLVDTLEHPEILGNALDAQRAAWDSRQLALASASAEVEKANDVVIATGLSCIAPKGPRELCGSYALVMGKTPEDHPPLCQDHIHMAAQYAPTNTGRLVNGKDEVIWKRVTVSQH